MAKIGEGHVEAMGRLGLKELRNAFNPSKESVADAELGLYGTATQKEINEDRGGVGDGMGKESMADLRAAAQEPHHGLPDEANKQQEQDKSLER